MICIFIKKIFGNFIIISYYYKKLKIMKWNNKLNGEDRYARTGSYVDENNLELSKERYNELMHISNLYVVDFLNEQMGNREVVPANDKHGKNHSKVLVDFKKRLMSDLLKRVKSKEFTMFESSKISQNFSIKTSPLYFTFAKVVTDDGIKSCKDKLKKEYKLLISKHDPLL